jgi:hypothetical protein
MDNLFAMDSFPDFKWMRARAITAPGDVIWTLTISPSLMAEHFALS